MYASAALTGMLADGSKSDSIIYMARRAFSIAQEMLVADILTYDENLAAVTKAQEEAQAKREKENPRTHVRHLNNSDMYEEEYPEF